MKKQIIYTLLMLCGMGSMVITPAQAQTNWPLNPTTQTHAIWTGYGQYTNNSSGHYHHEALDLIGNTGDTVRAIEGGRIVEIDNSGGQNGRMTILRGTDTTKAILYMHISIADRTPGTEWIVGNTVARGNIIGYIINYGGGIHSHTHIEWANDEATGSWSPTGAIEPDKEGNLIELLNPNTDTFPPTLVRPVRYRDAAGEGSATAAYFNKSTACGDTVIKGNTDIVTRAYDRFALYGALNFNISIKKLQFSILQYKPGTGTAVVPLTTPFHYTGRFLQAGAGPTAGEVNRNTFDKFRDQTLVYVDYEDDTTCDSYVGADAGDSANTVFFYIPTNKNENDSIQEWDAGRYWDTNGKFGQAWNDSIETAVTHEADSNKNAAFPDGRYIVRLKATGYGSNASDTAALNDTIFVNNFDEFIYSCDTLNRDKDTFCIGEPVFIKGKGYPKNRSFRVFVIKDTTWTNGMAMLGGAYRVAATTVTTDTAGRFGPVKIWNAYAPNSQPDKGYDILLDYDGDSLYTDTIQGLTKTVDTKDENLPGLKGIIGTDTMKVKITVQDVKCHGDSNGCVKVSITGGKKPYKLRIRGTGLDTTITDTAWCKLKAGTYLITVYGKDSCQITNDTVQIRQPAKMQINKNVTHVKCKGDCDGSIEITVTGGIRPYTYEWSGGSGNDTVLTDLCAGIYIVTVTDSNGCSVIDSIEVTEPDSALVLHLDSVHNITCAGMCNGAIYTHATGGTPGYYYNLIHDGDTTSQYYYGNFFNLCPGNYTVLVTDANGCTNSVNVSLNEPDSLSITGSVTPDSCNAGIGAISTSVSGGTPGYSCGWSVGGGSCSGLSNLHSGYYTIMVTDSMGCMGMATFFVPNYCDSLPDDTTVTDTTVTDTIVIDTNAASIRMGLRKLKAASTVYLYPNPAANTLHIVINSRMAVEVRLTDLAGREMFRHTYAATKGMETMQVDLSAMANGIYVYTISIPQTDAQPITGKLLIQK